MSGSEDAGREQTRLIECPVCGVGVRVEKGQEEERRELLREKCPRKFRDLDTGGGQEADDA